MMKRLYILIGVLLTVALVVGSFSCAKPAPQPGPAPHPPVELKIYSNPLGTTTYVLMVAFGDILTKNHPWIRASALETSSTAYNITRGSEEDPNKVLMSASDIDVWDAMAGKPPYERKYPEVKYIAGLLRTHQGFVTFDPNIKTPADMVGKKIALTPKVWGTSAIFVETLKVWGIYDKVTIEHMQFKAEADALADGLVAVAAQSAQVSLQGLWVPNPAMAELIATKGGKLHFIDIDEKTLKAVSDRLGYPLSSEPAPAGSYGPAQTAPFRGFVALSVGLASFSRADEDLIYEVTKALATNSFRFKEYHTSGKDITPERLVQTLTITDEKDMHPGALKYYKEAGLWKLFKK